MNKGLWWFLLAALVVTGVLWTRAQARADSLVVGAPAPDFALPDARGDLRQLADFRGEWLLLYFYPKDDTPGCTTQACAYRDGYQELRARGLQVVGVSMDDGTSHQAFAEKYRLPFPLLSDRTGEIAKRYGALWSFGPLRFARRHGFLIDAEGQIVRIYRQVDPETHYRQVLEDLTQAQAQTQMQTAPVE
ncbi:MAG: peroxiredoxin [Gammaproteobacteria bacterium]